MADAYCGHCGWLELHLNDDGTIECRNCVTEWPDREAYLRSLLDLIYREWSAWDEFTKGVMTNRKTEEILVKTATALITKKVDLEVVEYLLHALNERDTTPIPMGQVGFILVQAAQAAPA